MGWRDDNERVEESDIPKVGQYFPTYTADGQVIDANQNLQMDDETLRQYETMKFDEGRSQTGQIVGSISASMATMGKTAKVLGDTFNIKGKDVKNLIPKVIRAPVRVGLQMISAWTGGTTGDLAQSVVTGDVKKHGWNVAFDSAFDAGNEEAMWELLGLTAVGAGVKVARWAAGKPYANIKWIKDQIAASGGKLTASQVVDGTILDTVEGLAEVSWGGRHIRETRVLNEEAIHKYAMELVDNYVEQGGKHLSDFELGKVYSHAVNTALKHHKTVGGQMFEHLDEVIAANRQYTKKTFTRVEPVTAGDVYKARYETNRPNRMLGQKVTTTQKVEILPVNTKTLKAWAARELKKIEGVKGAVNSWRYKYFQTILDDVGDQISFKAAQSLRSEWLEKGRVFANRTSDSFSLADKAATEQLTKHLDNSMSFAAARIGGDFYEQFRHANKYWKTGKERMANKIITGIMNQNPERVGAQIFATGNVTEIRKARHALKSAAFFTKGTEGAIDFNRTWKQMQQGYLNDLIGGARQTTTTQLTEGAAKQAGTDIASTQLKLSDLKKLFTDPKVNRTFEAAFTKEQRVAIKRFMTSIEAAQKMPHGTGSFMVTVTQGGLVLAAGSAGAMAGGAMGAAVGVGTFTFTAAMVSRALTDPKVTTWLAKGLHLQPGHKEYIPTLMKLMNYAGLAPSVD